MTGENHQRKRQRESMVALTASSSATILIGISLDEHESKELLSWAITILAHPNDTLVALHVLEGKEPKKLAWKSRDHMQYQRSKAFVISVMGEFANACRSKQVYLQARVRYSSSIDKGLIKEAKAVSAAFLLLGGSKHSSKGTRHGVTNYCFNHAPKGCSVMSIGQREASVHNILKSSPTSDDDDSSSLSESSSSPPLVLRKHKPTPLKRIVSSLFRLPFDVHSKKTTDADTSTQEKAQNQPPLSCFSYEDISTATNDFHLDNMVGRGGYSEVYRGDLLDGSTIAVKRLAKDNTNPRKEMEFLMELGIIGHVSHPNTASLTGYCIEHGLYLIFNYSPNGNLSNALHGTQLKLEWPVRYKIVVGVARGLHYLHRCCKHRIIHRDIKASNILLGLDLEPQITDFGLAKWLPSKGSNHAVASIIEGTFGYLAPEYFMHGMVDEKTDVYAFGVLLLEIVTGRMPVDHLTKQNLLLWATPLVESGKIEELVDPRLKGAYEVDQVHKLVLLASHCVQHSSSCRPSMTEVLEQFECSYGNNQRWRMPKISTDQVNDYSMAFGYNIPIHLNLEEQEEDDR